MSTYSLGEPEPTTPITPATTPADSSAPATSSAQPAATGSAPPPATPTQQVSLGRALAPVGAIAVITAGTASWQLLGPWPTIGSACGVLIVIGGIARWRQGEHSFPFTAPATGRRWRATPKTARQTRASASASAPARSAQRHLGARMSPAALARPRPRRATLPRSPLAQPRPQERQPQRHRNRKRGRKRAGWQVPTPEWGWTRGAVAVLITPLALLLSGATHLVGALRPITERPQQEPDEASAGAEQTRDEPESPDQVPVIARPGPAIARPTPTPASSSTTTSRTTMTLSTSPHTYAAADAIRDYIGGFVPKNAADLTGFVCGLHEVFQALQESLAGINTRFGDEEPVDPRVVDHLNELRGMLAPLVDFAAEAGPMFLAAHEADLQRLENPRPNEQLMDYSQQ